jgi:WD40 repeat protein
MSGLQFSPDGQYLAAGSADGSLRLWQRTSDTPSKWTLVRDLSARSAISGLGFVGQSKIAAASTAGLQSYTIPDLIPHKLASTDSGITSLNISLGFTRIAT